MILAVYQTPPAPIGYPVTENLPAAAASFIGQHTGNLPKLGETFCRYGSEWRIVESNTTGKAPWTFRARAEVLSPVAASA